MVKKFFSVLTAFTFYAFSTNLYRVGVAGFAVPLPILALGAYALFFSARFYLSKRFKWCVALLLLFIGIASVSAIINSPLDSLPFLAKLAFCSLVFFAAYLVSSNTTDSELSRFLLCISISSSVFAAGHVFYYYFVLNAPYLSIGLDGLISEAGKNQLANYLGALFVLSFCVYRIVDKSSERLLCGAAILVHLAALLYTFSRSPLIVSVIALMLFYLLSSNSERTPREKNRLLFLSGVIIAAASYGASLPEQLVSQFFENIWSIVLFEDQAESTSILVRRQLIFHAFELFSSSPVLGYGPEAFVGKVGIATHNSYLQLLTEVGILGTFAFCGFLAVVTIGASASRTVQILTTVVIFLVGSLFFQNAVDSPFLYVFLGLCVGARRRRKSRKIEKPQAQISLRNF